MFFWFSLSLIRPLTQTMEMLPVPGFMACTRITQRCSAITMLTGPALTITTTVTILAMAMCTFSSKRSFLFSVPTVVSDCTRFVEKHGIVDGIYRISGVSSHIRHLKYEFDSDRRPDLENDLIDLPKLGNVPGLDREVAMRCDPHSVAGLCKLYFR